MVKSDVNRAKDVPLGGLIEIDGRVYECVEEWKEGYCYGCDLFCGRCVGIVICTEECRKDGQGVIYKEVKQ